MNALGRHRLVPSRTVRAAAFGCIVAAGALLVGACGTDGTPVSDGSTPSADTSADTSASSTPSTGAPVMAGGAFRVTAAAGQPKVVVTIIEDLACPACQQFESLTGTTLDGYAADPEIAIDYQIISFLDRVSPDRYSSRAANASYCVWHAGDGSATSQARWRGFQHTMFGRQPDEGGPGLGDDEIIAIAAESDVPDVADCITSGQYSDAVAATTDAVTNGSDFEGTPTVLVNGEKVTARSASELKAAVDAARR
ncbi:DsbA family protein [Gordonia liuliyuniae]|uniref:DsbA family protein n=1 Tax=Gordonia liuliyuniae TaxID=2911517 RepID=A0ABS9IN26_9ACTN|nr:thioredoxin domain-containing protein [Gordonia liuliyuniae]MCF8586952.1 DsbA family protein [Gordonia liuliyuniae]